MSTFSEVAEVNNAVACLRDARQKILDLYPLTDRNEWVQAPPAEVCESLQLIDAARQHLENLCEFGNSTN